MTYYRSVGRVPRKRHTVHRSESGERLLEELIGVEGFSGPSSLLYHLRSPSAIVEVVPVADGGRTLRPHEPVAPLHLRTASLPVGGDVVTGRQVLLGNADVVIATVAATEPGPLYRNAAGDELLYVRAGRATLETSMGTLAVADGDYVVVPAGVTQRWSVGPGAPFEALVVEARGHVRPPRRYRSDTGQLLEHAPYCERDVRTPDGPHVVEDDEVDVLVRTRTGLSRLRHRHHPFDVVGWDGCLYPWALSIHDFEPIVGSIHQPPPVHQTFEGPGFVVCSFVPRPYDFHRDAVKIPYHHANVDSDEVLFYAAGDFMSRAGSGVDVGSLTLHPAGFVHGPQPGSWERSVDATATNELAVMIDTFRPLQVTDETASIADDRYVWSWLSPADSPAR